jgi:excisionase family DNA binding protein
VMDEETIVPLLHDSKAAAARLGIGTTKLRELIAAGEVRTVRIGTRLLIPDSECVAFVDRLLG